MNEGLLWYDDDSGRDLAEKVKRAARRYRQKFGASPNVCYVHPSTLASASSAEPANNASTKLSAGGKARKVGGVRVAPLPSVLRHHFWLGQEEKQRARKRQQTRN